MKSYLKQIEKDLTAGNATEHTYRPALKNLIESLQKKITATNEPKREQCGAPDFIITQGQKTLGYIEAKDIGKSLKEVLKTDQLKRYLGSLNNLVLTDYLEFRWFVNGEHRLTATLATVGKNAKLKTDAESQEQVAELLNSFLNTQAVELANSRELATRMAGFARLIRDSIENALTEEKATSTLHQQMEAFKKVLLHSLEESEFADMYAQTICYGMFAARCNSKSSDFTRQKAAWFLPKTNPFLRNLFIHIAGPDLDSRIAWAVDDLAELLKHSDINGIMEEFGHRTRREDPVVHFYETFLAAYDPKMREIRGVYYTPEPVVSYIVRSVDHILKETFGLKKGLADSTKIKIPYPEGNKKLEYHKVQILDPATGTGTFLYEVIRQIHESFAKNRGMWPGYVSQHLLPRIFGFELLMAPYTVAHLKLVLLLEELGYDFQSEERLHVYLTNTLEEAFEGIQLPFADYLAKEANSAGQIKNNMPIMVILGNPPYSGHSANVGTWIKNLIDDYKMVDGKPLGERNPKWLQDDYVKFIRFAQWRIEQTGYGVLAFISNHGYLDNPTFRGMRQSLMNTFDEIYLLDLHGNTKKKEKCPDGSKDENVFDIQQGVAIGIFVKKNGSKQSAKVFHADLWGLREIFDGKGKGKKLASGKYHWLWGNELDTTTWTNLKPNSPSYYFVPFDPNSETEYKNYLHMNDVFLTNNMGITTGNDNKFIKFESNDFQKQFGNVNKVHTIAYRCFDKRFIWYDSNLLARARFGFMNNLIQNNIGLVTLRRPRNQKVDNFHLTNLITDKCFISSLDNANIAPLYLYPSQEPGDLFEATEAKAAEGKPKQGRKPNLSPEFIEDFAKKLKLKFVDDGAGDLKTTFGPEDVFFYIYGVFHSPAYRKRYAEFLKRDFPRVPLTSNKKLFQQLRTLGEEVGRLHLMETVGPEIASYPVSGGNAVDKVRYSEPEGDAPGRVWINKTQYFQGVPLAVWEFHIGGYRVCEKWLKDRKGRTLSFDDLTHYRNIVSALNETIRLMAEIDDAIAQHGGWPIK